MILAGVASPQFADSFNLLRRVVACALLCIGHSLFNIIAELFASVRVVVKHVRSYLLTGFGGMGFTLESHGNLTTQRHVIKGGISNGIVLLYEMLFEYVGVFLGKCFAYDFPGEVLPPIFFDSLEQQFAGT